MKGALVKEKKKPELECSLPTVINKQDVQRRTSGPGKHRISLNWVIFREGKSDGHNSSTVFVKKTASFK